jgi:hypothetical protein
MKKNTQNKLKLDKKTVSKLNSTEEVNVNGGIIALPFPTRTILETCFCYPRPTMRCNQPEVM